ncbi:MAG: sulfite exporter TauE/SafE family protein [Burkholderiales bacterium]|nr:sulfite exporter TauE/SafE family protein [Burkholderiales bacterium]
MNAEAGLTAALLAGLLGGGHCAGMCGGIAGMLVARGGGRRLLQACHHVGRIGSYAVIGGIAGSVGEVALFADRILPVQAVLWWLAQAMLLAVGLYLAGLWQGVRHIEALGGTVWKAISAHLPRLLPADTPGKALLAGAVWGWLPCGLVYSLVITALASGSGLAGALTLLLFGLGTLPNVWLIGSSARWSVWKHSAMRRAAGLLLAAWAVWTILRHLQWV